ncbi:hypothetical protein CR62_15180 [Serratia grimesii]|uniref:Secreted protein n=1 Tax=Serratia grimesii TaxID=82995 RepID=A0ABR4U537_9GAMM|nr:hypothetical protein CR62_15180 [Serratia grimesii]
MLPGIFLRLSVLRLACKAAIGMPGTTEKAGRSPYLARRRIFAQIVTETSRDLLSPLWHNARQITFPMI